MPYKTLEGHYSNLKQMAMYCENQSDCRRYVQLLHLGEMFDRTVCLANKETACDNCEKINNYQEKDVTKEAKHLAELVSDLSAKQNVTMIHVADVYNGSKAKKIIHSGHDRHPLHGCGAHLNKSDTHRILKQLIFKDVLVDFCTFNGDFPVVYVKKGPKFNALSSDDGILQNLFF